MHHLLLMLVLSCQLAPAPKHRVPPPPDFPAIDRPHERVELIYESGGDAEVVRGYIILVSLRYTTDKTFDLLSDLRAVRYLDIAHCKIDGSGLKNIVQMKRLEHLRMHDNRYRMEHFKHLGNLCSLTLLYLDNTNVDDSGLKHIAKLNKLKTLQLTNTAVSDESVELLASLSKLKYLDVSGTRLTKRGVSELKRRLPNTKISHSRFKR